MLYANVVLGLPVDEAFDYLVPVNLEGEINLGTRVRINFRNKKEIGYVVGLSNKTKIKKVKEIAALIDLAPILNSKMLELGKELAEYYCCSWGEAIEAALPEELRKGKEIDGDKKHGDGSLLQEVSLVEKENRPLFVQGEERMPVYLREIKQVLAAKQSAIILFSDVAAAEKAKAVIQESLSCEVFVAFRKQPNELQVWEKIRKTDSCVVAGTRSSIFSPVNNLGLIIIDQDEDQGYKQEQVPHYHAREVAFMRAKLEGAKVILGSQNASLESFYLAQNNKLEYEIIPSRLAYPEIKVIDLRRIPYAERKNKSIFSKFLADAIFQALTEKGKVLLVINRKGFATFAACQNCKEALKCPRCNLNLIFHYDENKLKCHHCNFKMEVPKICPSCNAGYIKYAGLGTEKVESELARIFPQARLNADIYVATSWKVEHLGITFDLIGVMVIDDSLNRLDFRAVEKTFNLLLDLTKLTAKKMIIQSANAGHFCFQALLKNDAQLFLKTELKERKELNFSPYQHMILLKIRGANEEKVQQAAQALFGQLSKIKTTSIKMLALNPGQPAKLRGNFYYQILLRTVNVKRANQFLKLHLKETHFSGIIVSIDVDPV